MAILDVTQQDFDQRVIERSREVPVVVDFWAEWCGPCKALSPALEKAAREREGRVDLAKVDTDTNEGLAQAFGIRGIPAVKAFKDGKVTDEFTGAIPPAQVEEFFDRLVPSDAELAADAAVESGDEEQLRRAVEANPRHAAAATALARLLIERGETDAALKVLEPLPNDFVAAGLRARAGLAARDADLEPAFEAWDSGDHAGALERLQEAFASAGDPELRDLIRQVMVAIFTELGADDPLAREHRRRLSSALY
ncbi:MAG: putative thioredoxin [Thermoleophilaceae bacterium]|nr:putative thioredoxin [Thermoleophilaceae bacterium]